MGTSRRQWIGHALLAGAFGALDSAAGALDEHNGVATSSIANRSHPHALEFPITEHYSRTSRHATHYLACGPEGGPLIIFIHGWPELSYSWRHQLRTFAALGFRAVAPDMRGYGRSSVYSNPADYELRFAVADMIELLASLGEKRALWVGHDWGSPVVWSLASHHPESCAGIANVCVPYLPEGMTLASLVPLVDRSVYPERDYPVGQWDYVLYYRESFERAHRVFEANVPGAFGTLLHKGVPDGLDLPAFTSRIRRTGGWFGGADAAPDLEADADLVTAADLSVYVEAFERVGFRGPNAWYCNDEANSAYARESPNRGLIQVPTLFVHARYDHICQTVRSRLADPMRRFCSALSECVLDTGHWVSQEDPVALSRAIARWIYQREPA